MCVRGCACLSSFNYYTSTIVVLYYYTILPLNNTKNEFSSSAAIDVVTVYVFHEPSLLSSLQDNGLTGVMLKALVVKEVLNNYNYMLLNLLDGYLTK